MLQTVLTGGLGYEGKVTLTLKNNNRVLSSKTYKNKGTVQLFRFLSYCLTDSFEEAKSLLPNKILLLYNDGEHPDTANPKNIAVRTNWQPYTHAPTIKHDNENEQVSVIYSFEINKAAITGKFNQIALYGAGMNLETDYQDFSAYYYLKDEFGNFEPQEVSLWSATTVLLIEWELTLSNKNIGTRNNEEEGI